MKKVALFCTLLSVSLLSFAVEYKPQDKKTFENLVKIPVFGKDLRLKELKQVAARMIQMGMSRWKEVVGPVETVQFVTIKMTVDDILKTTPSTKIFDAVRYATYDFDKKVDEGVRMGVVGVSARALPWQKRKDILKDEFQKLNEYYKKVIASIRNLERSTKSGFSPLPLEITPQAFGVNEIDRILLEQQRKAA